MECVKLFIDTAKGQLETVCAAKIHEYQNNIFYSFILRIITTVIFQVNNFIVLIILIIISTIFSDSQARRIRTGYFRVL